jgi:hypothetical protein
VEELKLRIPERNSEPLVPLLKMSTLA